MKKVFRRFARLFLGFTILLIILIANIMIINSILRYSPPDKLNLFVTGNGLPLKNEYREFSILTWNLGYAGLGKEMDFFYDGGKRVRPSKRKSELYLDGIRARLIALDKPDFYFFQEIDVGSKRSYLKNQLDTLSGALPNYNSAFAYNYRTWFVPAPLFNPMGKVRSGLAIFSKFLPSECIRYSFKSRFPWPKNLFMPTRCFILERFHLDNGKDLLLINTHNSTFDDGSLRRIELEALKSLMLEEFQKGNYVVTGGDWNSNPPGYMINTISNGDVAKEILPRLEGEFLPAGWKWAFDPLMPTNRDVDQSYVKGSTKTTIIDFFALSPNIELLSVKTVNTSFEYTDHNPVLLQFRLAE